MKKRQWQARTFVLALGGVSWLVLGGCGLTDQQMASIWESVISSALSTIVSSALQLATGQPA